MFIYLHLQYCVWAGGAIKFPQHQELCIFEVFAFISSLAKMQHKYRFQNIKILSKCKNSYTRVEINFNLSLLKLHLNKFVNNVGIMEKNYLSVKTQQSHKSLGYLDEEVSKGRFMCSHLLKS